MDNDLTIHFAHSFVDNDLTLQISLDYRNAPYTIVAAIPSTRTLYRLVANRSFADVSNYMCYVSNHMYIPKFAKDTLKFSLFGPWPTIPQGRAFGEIKKTSGGNMYIFSIKF